MNFKVKKFLVWAIGLGILTVGFLFVNLFTGNPVSRALAKSAVLQYVNDNYKELDLQITRCAYNFKFGEYFAFAQSDTSEDTAFGIYIDSFGNVLRDDYEYEVANNFTTYRRLEEELREKAIEIVANELSYDFEYCSLRFVDEADLMKLERDMELDIHNPPLPLLADVTLFSDDVSYEQIAQVAKSLEGILLEENVPAEAYSIRIIPLFDKPEDENQAASWVNDLSLSYFPANRMGEENLAEVMEEFETERVLRVNQEKEKELEVDNQK